jgi:catechol 2,3-dioxygenase
VPSSGRLGIYHYALLLPARADLGRFLLHLEALGEPWAASDHLVSEALYLTDPDGITVEVYADRPRAEWPRDGGGLRMAVDPLDRAGLAAAAAGSRWQGAPEGTRMGHLHLFVGDLAAAERHYVDRVGFDVVTRRLPGALFVSAGGYHHHLGLNTWAAGSPVAGERDAGLDEWTLELGTERSLDELEARLASAGVAASRGDGSVHVSDPWGIALRVGAVGDAGTGAP